ncbi:hypothetical protein C823_002342 [Eubacterium plexicaudatum ASF492]|uniref:Uncharacterized protein n=1 Tax=Eubacterium plexicaudatum ASF492 TaxID=1235802 RepID=N2BLZ9_9FIRM|nr:hypothetical protein C823_002342 [Eubacterium plexicaudatum ASF492]
MSVGGELAGELKKLKGQRTGSAYGIADEPEDSVRAYANLYDAIVQGYQDGTRERYVEDENSETGFRKMTMEEDSKNNKKPQGTDGNAPETAGTKMKRLAQEWREAYKTSGSKESSMEKVLSMLNGMFGIRKEA